ncbi:hypothetical protein EfmAA96_24790 [Enterococcus faecium]|nr:hypothetical protein EfmAA96_24790 [Enterococcus faecium]
MDTNAVKELADGRIYDGNQAVENGLVDQIGYSEDALDSLKKEKKLTDATVIEYNMTIIYKRWLFMKKVLVVDDEKPISDIVKFNLAKEGYDVYTAYDGEEALEKVAEVEPDLI